MCITVAKKNGCKGSFNSGSMHSSSRGVFLCKNLCNKNLKAHSSSTLGSTFDVIMNLTAMTEALYLSHALESKMFFKRV